MKNSKAVKANSRRIHTRKFLRTEEGRKWLERKQLESQELKLVRELQRFC